MATISSEETNSSELVNGNDHPLDAPAVAGEINDASTLAIADKVDTKESIVSTPVFASGDSFAKTIPQTPQPPQVTQPIRLRSEKEF